MTAMNDAATHAECMARLAVAEDLAKESTAALMRESVIRAAAERDRDEARQAWRAANDRLAELTRVDHLATPEGKADIDEVCPECGLIWEKHSPAWGVTGGLVCPEGKAEDE